jgi:hypothetical protein
VPKKKASQTSDAIEDAVAEYSKRSAMLDEWVASGEAARSSMTDLARKVAEQANSPALRAARELAETANNSPMLRAARELAETQQAAMSGLSSKLGQTAAKDLLADQYAMQHVLPPPPIIGPSAETRTANAVEELNTNLMAISSRNSEQIAQLANIAEVGVQQVTDSAAVTAEFRETMRDATHRAEIAAWIIIGLTVVLVVLTGVIVFLTVVLLNRPAA